MIGGLLLIVCRSLRQHALSTLVTVLSLALGSGLVMSVFAVNQQTHDAFVGNDVGYDAVLGARGSKLQLVLNTVYHLETSPGNIPWSLYTTMRDDRRVKLAIPYATGDNYYGHRMVGTTEEIFTEFEVRTDERFELVAGRAFDSRAKEAVLGNTVARATGLKVGDVIQPYHGLSFNPREKHSDEYVVVGVLEATNTPSDRIIWIPIEGIWRMEGHSLKREGAEIGEAEYVARPDEAVPEEYREISAVMLKFTAPTHGVYFSNLINDVGDQATLAFPLAEQLLIVFEKLGWVNQILEWVAYLVVLVAAGSILASLYNTMNERRREFAILRALGARRSTVFAAIVLESSIIGLIGALLGFIIYGVVVAVTESLIQTQTGVVINVFQLHPIHGWAPLGLVVLGALAGTLPALKAYSTDVAEHLVPTS